MRYTMAASFSYIHFKANVPEIHFSQQKIYVNYAVKVKADSETLLRIESVTFTNIYKEIYIWKNGSNDVYRLCKNEEHTFYVEIQTGSNHQTSKSAVFSFVIEDLLFGKKIFIEYTYYEKNHGWILSKVESVSEFYNLEDYRKLKEKKITPGVDGAINAHGEDKEKSNDDFINNSIPELKEYVKKLFQEMYFVQKEGGKQYKITNGRQIMSYAGRYLYTFEIDTEVNLVEDSPITLIVGHVETKGEVFMCVGFQIFLTVKDNLGKTIDSAYLKGEPWKLIQALAQKVSIINSDNSPLAMKLWNKGPILGGGETIDKIPKGQDKAIQKALLDDITIIWGPPGTGKTHTMASLALKFAFSGKKVLIVSHSNISVDGITKRIVELLSGKYEDFLKAGEVLRYGFVRDEDLSKNRMVVSY